MHYKTCKCSPDCRRREAEYREWLKAEEAKAKKASTALMPVILFGSTGTGRVMG